MEIPPQTPLQDRPPGRFEVASALLLTTILTPVAGQVGGTALALIRDKPENIEGIVTQGAGAAVLTGVSAFTWNQYPCNESRKT